jgi:hypothetical protein
MELNLAYFFITLILCFVILYIIYPEPEIIIKVKNPSIDYPVSDLYMDDNNLCYKYHRKEVQCNI